MEKFGLAYLISYILSALTGPKLIPTLRRLKFGQTEREEGPDSHKVKSGTPTMGGFIFIVPTVLVTFALGKFHYDTLIPVLAMLLFGLIGFIDDYIKVVKKRNLGLRAYQKIVLQLAFALLITFLHLKYSKYGTSLFLPFTDKMWDMGIWLYVPFLVFILIGVSNSVNLTDGLDGLCTSVTACVMFFFWLLSRDLNMAGLGIFCASLIAACIGFLGVNRYPAKVFMGDTGSMALGGAVATAAILLHVPLVLPIVGIIYMLETLSVIIQVASFKMTGKRVFRMSPLHHHFELGGWSEQKVTIVFFITTVLFLMIGLFSLAKIY